MWICKVCGDVTGVAIGIRTPTYGICKKCKQLQLLAEKSQISDELSFNEEARHRGVIARKLIAKIGEETYYKIK
jgi:hypothetical protein